MSKKAFISLITLTLILLFSCVVWEEPADRSNFIISENGESITLHALSDGLEHQWYSSESENFENSTFEGTGDSINTASFEKPSIKYYRYNSLKNGKISYSSPIFYIIYSGLPTVAINTTDGKEIKSKVTYSEATISISGNTNQDYDLAVCPVEIKGRGASSWMLVENKSYNLKFNEKTEFFGRKKSKKWILSANFIDNSELANWYASYIGNNIYNKVWEPYFTPVQLVMNGEYRGMYLFGESVKIEKQRINIPDISEVKNLEEGGFVLEITTESDISSFLTLHGIQITFKDPDLYELTGGHSLREIVRLAQNKVNRLERAILGESNEDFTTLINLDSMVDWFLVNLILANNEAGMHTSCYFYWNPEKNMFFMGPNWDFDRGLTNRNPDNACPLISQNLWFLALMNNPTFTTALKNQWNLQKSNLVNSVDILCKEADYTAVALKADSLRWNKSIIGSSEELRTWMNNRINYIDSLLAAY